MQSRQGKARHSSIRTELPIRPEPYMPRSLLAGAFCCFKQLTFAEAQPHNIFLYDISFAAMIASVARVATKARAHGWPIESSRTALCGTAPVSGMRARSNGISLIDGDELEFKALEQVPEHDKSDA
jgi:hypothetical protein